MLIRITKSPYSHGTVLEVNGRSVAIPPQGETLVIDEALLPALGDSHIGYEIAYPIVGAADEAGEAPGGSLGDSPAEPQTKGARKSLPRRKSPKKPIPQRSKRP